MLQKFWQPRNNARGRAQASQQTQTFVSISAKKKKKKVVVLEYFNSLNVEFELRCEDFEQWFYNNQQIRQKLAI